MEKTCKVFILYQVKPLVGVDVVLVATPHVATLGRASSAVEWSERTIDFQPFRIPSPEITLHVKCHPGTSEMECTKPHGGGAESLQRGADFHTFSISQRVAEAAPFFLEARRDESVGRGAEGFLPVPLEIQILPDIREEAGVGEVCFDVHWRDKRKPVPDSFRDARSRMPSRCRCY